MAYLLSGVRGFRSTAALAIAGALAACAAPNDGEPAEGVASTAEALCTGVKLTSSVPSPLASGSATLVHATGATCDPGQTPEYRFMYRREGGPTTYTEFRGWSLD